MKQMKSLANFSTILVSQTNVKPIGSILFLHGSGDTGRGIKEWVDGVFGKEFRFPDLRVLYPSAPPRPYSLAGGAVSTVWFDRHGLSLDLNEDEPSTNAMCERICSLIDCEVEAGIPENKIILGGFSQGGCLALNVTYRYRRKLAGTFALSSFLSHNSSVFRDLEKCQDTNLPPLFQAHGKLDEMINFNWGKTTNERLCSLGVASEFEGYNVYHEFNKKEITSLHNWIMKTLS